MHRYYRDMITERRIREERRKETKEVLFGIFAAVVFVIGFTFPIWCPLSWMCR